MPLNASGTISLRCGRLDLALGVVSRGGAAVHLSRVEHRLLAYLIEREGERVTREQLLVDVWGYRPGVQSRTVFSTVDRLRRKIELDPSQPDHLLTEPLGGYRLVLHGGATSAVWGREALVTSLVERSGSIALTGPPGIGKSTIARLVAARVPGAVLYVDLEPAVDAASEIAALRRALDTDPRADLRAALRHRAPLLLVLDGMGAGAAELARLVADLDGVRALATTTSDPTGWTALAVPSLDSGEAITLLETHLKALGRSLPPVDGTPWAERLCDAAGNHPLAIVQLAHALDLLGPEDLLERPERLLHASTALQDALALGWGALGDADRAALARLAVCTAPFPLDAAEHLLEEDPGAIARLARTAWIERVPGPGRTRLRLLPPIRAFIVQHTQPQPDALYAWCVARLTRALAALDGADGGREASALAEDLPLILHTLEHRAPSESVALLERLAPVLSRVGLDPRLAQWLRDAGTRPGLLIGLGRVRVFEGEDARDTLEAAVERSEGDARLECEARIELAVALRLAGDLDRSLMELDAAERIANASGDVQQLARATCERAMTLRARGDRHGARAVADDAIALARRTQNLRLETAARGLLGTLARQEGRLQEAAVMLSAAVAGSEQVGDAHNAAIARCNLANLLLDLERFAEARAELDAALAFFEPRGYRYSPGFARLTLAHVALGEGDHPLATREALEARLAFLTARLPIGVAHAASLLGRLAHADGRVSEARLAYVEAREAHPDWLTPRILLALLDRDWSTLDALLAEHADTALARSLVAARADAASLDAWIAALGTRAPDAAGLF